MPKTLVAGPHLRALIDVVTRWNRRDETDRRLLASAVSTTSPELRALLEAAAAGTSGPYGISIDEYCLVSHDLDDTVPMPSYSEHDGFDEGKIVIGHSPGGDLFVVETAPKGKTAPVWRMAHDEEWTPYREADSLESFLEKNMAELRATDPAHEIVVALAHAKREKPLPLKSAAAPAKASKKGTSASKKKSSGASKVAWRAASRPNDVSPENEVIAALRERFPYPTAIVLDASPYPLVLTKDELDVRVMLARGDELVPLQVPVLRDVRWALSPSRTSLVIGTPLRLFHVDLPTATVNEVPSVGWYDAVSFVDDTLFVLATNEKWLEPARTAEIDALRANYAAAGERVWIFAEGALHVMVVGKGCAPTCVQRIRGGAPELTGFVRRLLVVRQPRMPGERENALDALTWIFAVKNQRLIFLASLSKDPGYLREVDGRIFGDNGYELVNFEAAIEHAGDVPASKLPTETTTTQENIEAVPMLPVRSASAERPPEKAVRMLPESVAQTFGWASPPYDLRYAFNADATRCLVTFGKNYLAEVWEIDTATGEATKLNIENAYFVPEACGWLSDRIAFAPATRPIGAWVQVGRREGEKIILTMLLAQASRLFPLSDGRLLTGVPTDATYMGFTSSVLALVDDKPVVVGKLAQGATRVWEQGGRTFFEATDGNVYELVS